MTPVPIGTLHAQIATLDVRLWDVVMRCPLLVDTVLATLRRDEWQKSAYWLAVDTSRKHPDKFKKVLALDPCAVESVSDEVTTALLQAYKALRSARQTLDKIRSYWAKSDAAHGPSLELSNLDGPLPLPGSVALSIDPKRLEQLHARWRTAQEIVTSVRGMGLAPDEAYALGRMLRKIRQRRARLVLEAQKHLSESDADSRAASTDATEAGASFKSSLLALTDVDLDARFQEARQSWAQAAMASALLSQSVVTPKLRAAVGSASFRSISKLLEEIAELQEQMRRKKTLTEAQKKELRRTLRERRSELAVLACSDNTLLDKFIRPAARDLIAWSRRSLRLLTERMELSARWRIPFADVRAIWKEARTSPKIRQRAIRKFNLTEELYARIDDELRVSLRVWRQHERQAGLRLEDAERWLRALGREERWLAHVEHEVQRRAARFANTSPAKSPSLLPAKPSPPEHTAAGEIEIDPLVSTAITSGVVMHVEQLGGIAGAPSGVAPVKANTRHRVPLKIGDRGSRSSSDKRASQLGLLGEQLVFTLQMYRWRAAAVHAPDRAICLLNVIAQQYWGMEDTSVWEAAVADLRSGAHAAPASALRSLLWPASTLLGDRMGFDLFGLTDASDDILCIEVKTTEGPDTQPFELTINEYRTALREGPRYAIARVAHALRTSPIVALWPDIARLEHTGSLRLAPSRYTATLMRPQLELNGTGNNPESLGVRSNVRYARDAKAPPVPPESLWSATLLERNEGRFSSDQILLLERTDVPVPTEDREFRMWCRRLVDRELWTFVENIFYEEGRLSMIFATEGLGRMPKRLMLEQPKMPSLGMTVRLFLEDESPFAAFTIRSLSKLSSTEVISREAALVE
ncbi:DUF3883 domain-containing protein [Corallococcus interemptor]|uniref:protein NO VEIN domain-containing protein n=1 Tax=Corallococcus interemptor TaxID=2316720 RepID=UPI0035D4EE99